MALAAKALVIAPAKKKTASTGLVIHHTWKKNLPGLITAEDAEREPLHSRLFS